MAQRFGGRFSPGAAPGGPAVPAPPRRSRLGLRVNLLFLLPLPLAVRAFLQPAGGLLLSLGGLGLLLLGAWLTREGELAQEAYEARSVARRPAIPRKIFGSVATGLGLGVASLAQGGPVVAVALGLLGAALHLMAFGADPLSDKGMAGIDTHAQDRAARAVDEAEGYLAAMREAIQRTRDRALEARVDRLSATARAMFRQVEEDPRDLAAARKYLTVYLLGARDATAKFADLYLRGRDPQVRADYEALLTDLEAGFAQQSVRLMSASRSDLDVEISVLRERLEREGIRTG